VKGKGTNLSLLLWSHLGLRDRYREGLKVEAMVERRAELRGGGNLRRKGKGGRGGRPSMSQGKETFRGLYLSLICSKVTWRGGADLLEVVGAKIKS